MYRIVVLLLFCTRSLSLLVIVYKAWVLVVLLSICWSFRVLFVVIALLRHVIFACLSYLSVHISASSLGGSRAYIAGTEATERGGREKKAYVCTIGTPSGHRR